MHKSCPLRRDPSGCLRFISPNHISETVACGTPPRAALRASHPGSPLLHAPDISLFPARALRRSAAKQRWEKQDHGGRDVCVRRGGRNVPCGQPCLWALETTLMVHLGPVAASQAGDAAPTLALNLHHVSLQTQRAARAIWFPTNVLISSLLGSLPPWVSRKTLYCGGGGALYHRDTALCKFSELCPREPEESKIQTGRGSGLGASVHVHGRMETERMTLLHA